MNAEIYASPDGWRFRMRGGNGEIMATGEAYVRRIDAEHALKVLFISGPVNVAVRNMVNEVVSNYTLGATHRRPRAWTPSMTAHWRTPRPQGRAPMSEPTYARVSTTWPCNHRRCWWRRLRHRPCRLGTVIVQVPNVYEGLLGTTMSEIVRAARRWWRCWSTTAAR